MKIEKLTRKQEKEFPKYVKKWLDIGLSTEKANRKEAEKGIKLLYENVNLKKPKFIIWVDSPFACLKAYIIFKNTCKINNVEDQTFKQDKNKIHNHDENNDKNKVNNKTWKQMWKQAWRQIKGQVSAKVWKNAMDHVWRQNTNQVWNGVWNHIWCQIRVKVKKNIFDQIDRKLSNDQIGDPVRNLCHGQNDADSLGFYDFFENACGLKEETKMLMGVKKISENASWYLPYTNVCFISERPKTIKFDENKRLHADGEKAIEYRDGFGTYSWHGIKIPEKYGSINSDKWKAKWIIKEKNAELRKILIEGIGYDRMVYELNGKVIDTWKEYELIKIKNIDVETIHILKMECSSIGAIYCLRVPPTIDKARNAIKWTNWGIDKDDFTKET